MDELVTFFQTPGGVVVAGLLAALAGFLWFALDTKREQVRKRCIELQTLLSAQGFQRLPRMLTDVAVGDLSGLLHEIGELAQIYADPAKRAAELENVFANLLKAKLADPNQLVALKKLVTDAQAALSSGNPLASVDALKADLMASVQASPLGSNLLAHQFPSLVPGVSDDQVKAVLAKLGITAPAVSPGAAVATPTPAGATA